MKKYKFRSESIVDVFYFFNNCPAGSVKNIEANKLEGLDFAPDVEITFESKFTLDEFQGYCSMVEDGHVMLQTIQLSDNYTGERNYELESKA